MNNILSIVWIFFMILNGTKGDVPTEILTHLNLQRMKTAHAQRISNMWKLSWDEGMVKVAENFAEYGVHRFRNAVNYRLFLLFGHPGSAQDEEERWQHNFWDHPEVTYIKPDTSEEFDKERHYRESFMMTQTKVGCVAYNEKYELDQKEYEFKYLCAIGPNGYFRDHGTAIDIRGKPGSNCVNGHNDGDGLCVPGLATTGGPPTVKPTTNSDQEFTTKDPEAEEWDLIINLNSAGGKGTLLGFFVVFFGVLMV